MQHIPRKNKCQVFLLRLNEDYFLGAYEDRLVILDEIHRAPDLFQTLRRGQLSDQPNGRIRWFGVADARSDKTALTVG